MKAEVLESASSAPATERNSREPIHPSSPRGRRWRTSIVVSLGLLSLAASFAIAAFTLRSYASPSSAPSSSASALSDDVRWYSLGWVDIQGGVTTLYPLQLGRVKKIAARENEPVKTGDPLLYMDDTVQLIKVREAEADLEGARKQLAIAEAGLEETNKQIEAQKIAIVAARKKVDLARILRDKHKGFEEKGIEGNKETLRAAEIGVEQAETGVQAEEAKLAVVEAIKRKTEGYVAAAKVAIRGKQAQLDESNNAVKQCVLRAPEDGMPLRINVNPGETLGGNPRHAAIEFKADRSLLVRAEVEQEFVGHVHPGQNVIILDHVTGKECARGKVASIAQWYAPRRSANAEILTMNNDNRTLECIVHLDANSQEIRIGQRVRVNFPN